MKVDLSKELAEDLSAEMRMNNRDQDLHALAVELAHQAHVTTWANESAREWDLSSLNARILTV